MKNINQKIILIMNIMIKSHIWNIYAKGVKKECNVQDLIQIFIRSYLLITKFHYILYISILSTQTGLCNIIIPKNYICEINYYLH